MSPVHRRIVYTLPRADAPGGIEVEPRYHDDQRDPGGWWTIEFRLAGEGSTPDESFSLRPEQLRDLADQLERDGVR